MYGLMRKKVPCGEVVNKTPYGRTLGTSELSSGGFVANFAQEIMKGQLPLSVEVWSAIITEVLQS